jgi:hypothetical protein
MCVELLLELPASIDFYGHTGMPAGICYPRIAGAGAVNLPVADSGRGRMHGFQHAGADILR